VSTIGFTADWLAAGAAGAGAATGAAAAGTDARAVLVTVVFVTVRVAAGFAVATRLGLATVLAGVTTSGVVVSATGGVVVSSTGAGSALTGAGVVVVGVVGCAGASCASTGVDESARAAAIAGRALLRA
jgi:hypothetical protein